MGKRNRVLGVQRKTFSLLLGAIYLLPGYAHSTDLSCLATHVITLSHSRHRSGLESRGQSSLISVHPDGHFLTGAAAAYVVDAAGEVHVELSFPADAGTVGLPFQVFAVELKLGGTTEYFQDLSQGCTAPGAAIFPGEKITLLPSKVSEASVRACERGCPVALRVWGRR